MNNELLYKASILEDQYKESEGKINFVNQQLAELEQFNLALNSFKHSNEDKMLSSFGKGVYVKTKLESKDLFVEVGAGIVLKKNPDEMTKIIENQLLKLREIRIQLIN